MGEEFDTNFRNKWIRRHFSTELRVHWTMGLSCFVDVHGRLANKAWYFQSAHYPDVSFPQTATMSFREINYCSNALERPDKSWQKIPINIFESTWYVIYDTLFPWFWNDTFRFEYERNGKAVEDLFIWTHLLNYLALILFFCRLSLCPWLSRLAKNLSLTPL